MLIREIDRLAHIAVNNNRTVRKDNLLVQLKHLNRLYSEAELSETATNEVQRLRENFAELLRNEQKNYNLIIAYKRTTTFSSGVIMAISLSFAITALYYSYRYYNQQKAIIEKSNSTTTDVQRVQADAYSNIQTAALLMSLATLLNLLYNLIKSMIDYLWLDKNLELNKYCKTVIDGFSRFHDDLKKTLETEKLPGFNKNLHSLTGQALNEDFEELDQHNDSLPEQSRSRVASILSPQPQNIFINSSASSNSPQV